MSGNIAVVAVSSYFGALTATWAIIAIIEWGEACQDLIRDRVKRKEIDSLERLTGITGIVVHDKIITVACRLPLSRAGCSSCSLL